MTQSFASDMPFGKQHHTAYCRIAGSQVHYLKEGQGPPLILLHGGGTWMWTWRHVLPMFTKQFTVYAVDMPGFGLTVTARPFAPTEDYYADFLNEFLGAMHITKASLVGSSWGGGWALRFAQRYPERVERLVLIDSAGLYYHNLRRPTFLWNLITYPLIGRWLALHAVAPALLRRQYASLFVDKSRIPKEAGQALFAGLPTAANRLVLYTYGYRDMWPKTDHDLGMVQAPALLIWGARDPMFPLGDAYRLQQRLADASVTVLPDAGHLPHEERPVETGAAILTWLTSAPPGSTGRVTQRQKQ